MLSMVFKLCYPKSPWNRHVPGMKTMLRTYAAPPWVVGSVFPKLGFVQKGELPGHLEGVLQLRGCAARRDEYGFMSDKHGFQNLPP